MPQTCPLHALQVTRALVEPFYVKPACMNFDLLFLSSFVKQHPVVGELRLECPAVMMKTGDVNGDSIHGPNSSPLFHYIRPLHPFMKKQEREVIKWQRAESHPCGGNAPEANMAF